MKIQTLIPTASKHRQFVVSLIVFFSLLAYSADRCMAQGKIFSLAAAQNTYAQEDGNAGGPIAKVPKAQQVVARLSSYEVKPEYLQRFRKLMSAYVQYSLVSKGNIMAEAYFEREKPTVLWLVERWSDNAAMDKTASSEPARTLAAHGSHALEKPVSYIFLKDLEPLSKQQWRKVSRVGDDQLTIMLFVDSRPGTEQKFRDIYHVAMPQFRGEPGVVTYQLSQLENDNTKFVTYEKFRSNDAFQYHLKFKPITPVIDYLNTSIKKQPFQDGIHNLIEFAPLTREKNKNK